MLCVGGRAFAWEREQRGGVGAFLLPCIRSLSFLSSMDLHSDLTFSLNSCSVASIKAGCPTTAFIVSTVSFRSTKEGALPAHSLNFPRIPILAAASVLPLHTLD